MSDIIDTLHPEGKPEDSIYPNVKKDNIPGGSIDFNKLSPEVVQAINRGPQVVNTEAYILALSSDQGMAVGTDTGKWYYWNGTQYVEGGVYLANFGLYYKVMTSSDLTLSSSIIANGGVAHNTYTIIEASLSNSLLSAVTSDDYTINVDLGALSAALNLGLPSSSIVYLTKTTDEVGNFSYEDVSMDPFSATMHKFSAIANGERITLKFFHLYETADSKYLIVIEKGESLEVYTVDESCIFYGTTLFDFRIAIAAGSTALAAGMTPVLHQIIDGVEQEENLIKLVPSDSRVVNGASIFVDNNGAVCFGTAGSSGGVTENTEVSICKVSLPEGSYQYKLTVRFEIMVGAAYFGCGLKTLGASAADSALIQVGHQFSSTVVATATENATATLTSTRDSNWSLKPEFTDILDRRNCVLAVKAGLIDNEFGNLNLYYYFTVCGKGSNVLDSTLVLLRAFVSMLFTFGSYYTMVLTRANDIYTVLSLTQFDLLKYGYEYPYDDPVTGEETPGSFYVNNGDLQTSMFETTNRATENSTKLISSGGTYKAIEESKQRSTKDLEYFDEEIPVGDFQKLQLKELGGMSYKSKNLIGLPDTLETTMGGITYKIENGVVTFSGTSNQQYGTNIWILLTKPIPSGYTIAYNPFKSDASYNFIYLGKTINNYSGNIHMYQSGTTTTTEQFNYLLLQFSYNTTYTTTTVQPMAVRGTTAPTTYQAYFSVIRNSAVNAIESYGANLFGNYTTNTAANVSSWSYDSSQTISFVASGSDARIGAVLNAGQSYYTDYGTLYEVKPNTTYSYLFDGNFDKSYVSFLTESKVGIRYSQLNNASGTFTTDSNAKYILFRFGVNSPSSGARYSTKFIVVKDKIIPSQFIPYRGLIEIQHVTSAIRELTGYGWGINDSLYNYIDFDRKVFVQKVGRVDLGTLTWTLRNPGDSAYFYAYLSGALQSITLLCAKYDSEYVFTSNTNDKSVCTVLNSIRIRDLSYTDAALFKTSLNGVYLYYELPIPVETDVSAYLDTSAISVEYQGRIELKDTSENPCIVPLTLNYVTEKPLIEDLVDALGRPRFIEGEGTPISLTGLTVTYCKWSLSGTHLMLVMAGTVANGTSLTSGDRFSFYVPIWVLNKVSPVWDDSIEYKQVTLYASGGSSQSTGGRLIKKSDNLTVWLGSATLTATRNFKLQFDLLIDTD